MKMRYNIQNIMRAKCPSGIDAFGSDGLGQSGAKKVRDARTDFFLLFFIFYELNENFPIFGKEIKVPEIRCCESDSTLSPSLSLSLLHSLSLSLSLIALVMHR